MRMVSSDRTEEWLVALQLFEARGSRAVEGSGVFNLVVP